MYHYTECGLDNVWLRSGYIEKKTKYGDVVAFEDVKKLHDEICHVLIRKASRLSGPEFRFLRKELGFSQGSLGEIMGITHQAVAIWEKSNKVPRVNDLFLRGLYREITNGNAELQNAIDIVNNNDLENYQLEMRFDGGWQGHTLCA